MLSIAVPGGFAQPSNVRDVVELYLRHAANEIEPESFAGRKATLLDFVDQFGALSLGECRAYHLQLWLDAHPAWLSNNTRRRGVAGVQRAFNWAVKLGLLPINPFKGFAVPEGERGEQMEPWEYQGILRGTPPYFRRFVVALRYTAARPGELAKATWADVDWEKSCIDLERHKTRKKTKRPRRIVLDLVVLKMLHWLRCHPSGTPLLFPNGQGRRWTNGAIAWHVGKLQDSGAIGPTTTLYGLRHMLITELVCADTNMAVVAEIAGHERIATTMTYTHLGNKTAHLRAALGKVFRKQR